MITTFFDESCKILNTSQGLELKENYSAFWFCVERSSESSALFRLVVSTFDSVDCYFWLAFSGGKETPRILDAKRSFGHWAVSNRDVISKHETMDKNGNKLYSDIAKVHAGNIDSFDQVVNRRLFGIDSSAFFLPVGATLTGNNVTKPLVDLLIKRSAMDAIYESELNQGAIESFVDEIIRMDGFATVTMRDSNTGLLICVVGKNSALTGIKESIEGEPIEEKSRHLYSEAEFNKIMNIGVGVSIFN